MWVWAWCAFQLYQQLALLHQYVGTHQWCFPTEDIITVAHMDSGGMALPLFIAPLPHWQARILHMLNQCLLVFEHNVGRARPLPWDREQGDAIHVSARICLDVTRGCDRFQLPTPQACCHAAPIIGCARCAVNAPPLSRQAHHIPQIQAPTFVVGQTPHWCGARSVLPDGKTTRGHVLRWPTMFELMLC